MKIQALNTKNKPLVNTKIQLQIRGKDSGFLSCTTDDKGYLELDRKYQGQQIAPLTQGSSSGKWQPITEGTTLIIDTSSTLSGKKVKTTTQSYK